MKVQAGLMGAVLALSACGADTNMQLYPISGPLAQESPPPVISADASNDTGNSGTLKFKLPDRTKCEGTWTTVAPRVQSAERGIDLSIRGLGGKVKRSSESVGGINRGEIYAVCRDGTIVQGTFAIGSGTSSGSGTATDSRGNAYKLLF